MGCDIHTFVEKKNEDGKWIPVQDCHPFDRRSYSLFGFLANVYNLSQSPFITDFRMFPADSLRFDEKYLDELIEDGYFGMSWVTLKELLDYNYEVIFINKREGSKPEPVSMREFLGEGYFEELESLKKLGDSNNIRIIFYFDN